MARGRRDEPQLADHRQRVRDGGGHLVRALWRGAVPGGGFCFLRRDRRGARNGWRGVQLERAPPPWPARGISISPTGENFPLPGSKISEAARASKSAAPAAAKPPLKSTRPSASRVARWKPRPCARRSVSWNLPVVGS